MGLFRLLIVGLFLILHRLTPIDPALVKRSLAIFFLLLFLFNIGGYYFVFVGWQYKASLAVSEKLDKHLYDEEETYLFKIPLTLPYQITNNGYERVTGLIEHRGTFYRLVKQKHASDTLYVVCIRDHKQKAINDELTKYAKLSNDLPVSHETNQSNGKTVSLLSKLSKDFNTHQLLEILYPEQGYLESYFASASTFSLLTRDETVPTPPPEPAVG